MSLDLPKIHAKDKKALLFLHGYMSSGKSFAYQTKFFSSYFTVYAPDLTGFGENEYMPYPFSLDDYAKWVKDYMTANGIVKPHIIAHSFGGRVAIKLASTYPDLFDKIVLTGSAGLKPRRTAKYHFKRCAFKRTSICSERRTASFKSPAQCKTHFRFNASDSLSRHSC